VYLRTTGTGPPDLLPSADQAVFSIAFDSSIPRSLY